MMATRFCEPEPKTQTIVASPVSVKKIKIKCYLDDNKVSYVKNAKNEQRKESKVSDIKIKNKSLNTKELKKLLYKGQSSNWDTVKSQLTAVQAETVKLNNCGLKQTNPNDFVVQDSKLMFIVKHSEK